MVFYPLFGAFAVFENLCQKTIVTNIRLIHSYCRGDVEIKAMIIFGLVFAETLSCSAIFIISS